MSSDPEDKRPKVKITGSKDSLNDYIWDETKGVVQSGPFMGMQLIKEEVWQDGNIGTRCLGCYETEVHEIIEFEISRLGKLDNPKVVNIGCAEGFYAVGMARRLPKATIYAVDIAKESRELAQRAAALNNVSIATEADVTTYMESPDFVISDCEGAEIVYLDLEKFPSLARAVILVECHDYGQQKTTEILLHRFNKTHNIRWTITEGIRSPNQYEFLCRLPSHAKWLAVSEGRPSTQYFLYMVPR